MWAVICVVRRFRVVYDPLGVVGGMVQHNIDDTKKTFVSQPIHGLFKFCNPLNRSNRSWCIKVVIINSRLPCNRVMTEGFAVLLERSKMNGIISEVSDIHANFGPSFHFTKAPRHHSHETEFFAPDLLASKSHHWLNVDVLFWAVSMDCWIDCILISNLDEEAATLLKDDSVF